jgi:hypothetical protein
VRRGTAIDTRRRARIARTARSPAVAVAGLAAIAGGAGAWSLVTFTARQRLVPDDLRGRVSGAHQTLAFAATALGGVTGALVASRVSIAAPFAVAAAATAVGAFVARRLPPDLGAPADEPA